MMFFNPIFILLFNARLNCALGQFYVKGNIWLPVWTGKMNLFGIVGIPKRAD